MIRSSRHVAAVILIALVCADAPAHETEDSGNLFLDGHDNKLTVDVSRLELEYVDAAERSDVRWRLQWDVSF